MSSKLFVAAIDFGTTYSGYAYSATSDPLKIFANKAWIAEGELQSEKSPTTVLFKPDGSFHSFGYEAETHYCELASRNKHTGWRLFRRFKMVLLEHKNINENMELTDDQGKKMEARVVFGSAIKFLKNHLKDRIFEGHHDIKEDDIHYVLTVPAIWDDAAKQFMNEAARWAGIQSERFQLAIEPEAAALYCKEMKIQRDTVCNSDETALMALPPKSQFMIIDMGGGTVDITVHEVNGDGTLSEIYPPQGGPWGGNLVDIAFTRFLKNIFTEEVIETFANEEKEDALTIYRSFELVKRKFQPSKNKDVRMSLPVSLADIFSDIKREKIEKSLQRRTFENSVEYRRGKISFSSQCILDMYSEVKNSLIKELILLLKKQTLKKVKFLLMVGGFSESEIIKDAIKEAFSDKVIIHPEDGNLAVLKGAVLYGHNPKAIRSRRLPYTFGISVAVPFEAGHHPVKYSVLRGNILKCEHVFKVYASIGTEIILGETKIEHNITSDKETAKISIYMTKSASPKFVTDEGCRLLGYLEIPLTPGTSVNNHALLSVVFSFDTMLRVSVSEVKDRGTSEVTEARFDVFTQ